MQASRSDNARSPSNGRRRSRSPRDRRADQSEKRVYVSNIPYETKWMTLKDLFKEKVGDVVYVEMYEDESGRSKGCAVVELKSKEDAKRAIELVHHYEISGRKITVREEKEADRRRLEREAVPQSASGKRKLEDRDGGRGSARDLTPVGLGGMNGSANGGTNQWQGLLSSVPPKILQSIGVDPQGPLSSTLFVSNLSFNVKWKHIYETFSLAGKIVTGEMKLDDDGKSRGMAIVQMDNPLEAIQAISLFNNRSFFERKLSVRMDRFDGKDPGKKGDLNRANRGGMPEGLKDIGMGLGANGTIVDIGRLLSEQQLQMQQQQNLIGMNAGMSGMAAMANMLGMPGGGMGLGMGGGMGDGIGGGMGGGLGGNMGGGLGGGMGGGMAGNRGMGSAMGGGSMSSDLISREALGLASSLSPPNDIRASTGMMGLSGMAGMSGMREGPSSLSEQLRSMNRSGVGMGAGMGAGMDAMGSGMGSMGGPGLRGMGGMAMGAGLEGILDNLPRSSMANDAGLGRSLSNTMLGLDGGARGGGTPAPGKESSVFVRNLPFSVSWQELKDKFRSVGDVRFAEIKVKEGKSQGCGVVKFATREEACRAIDLFDGTRIDGREIEVRFDRA